MRVSSVDPATFRYRRNAVFARVSELGAPLLKVAARLASRTRPTQPASWRRGILLGADHIGDVLYNTASLPVLAEAFPDCEWHYVATRSAAAVLANNPALAGCISKVDMLESVDVAICYNSGGYWRDLLNAVSQRIPNRIGYVHKGFSALVTHPVQIRYPQPYPAYFRDLVAQLTGRTPDSSLRPKIYPSARDAADAETVWQRAGLGAEPVIACFLTSRQTSGVWPARKFAETVAQLEAAGIGRAVLCGAAEDGELLGEFKAQFRLRAPLLSAQLDLLALGCFLEKCAVVLCPDSGPRHLANAVGTPVVFVRNFAVGKIETGAYCETEIDAAPDLERVAPSAQPAAFEALTPARVTELVREKIRV